MIVIVRKHWDELHPTQVQLTYRPSMPARKPVLLCTVCPDCQTVLIFSATTQYGHHNGSIICQSTWKDVRERKLDPVGGFMRVIKAPARLRGVDS